MGPKPKSVSFKNDSINSNNSNRAKKGSKKSGSYLEDDQNYRLD